VITTIALALVSGVLLATWWETEEHALMVGVIFLTLLTFTRALLWVRSGRKK
jgi:hypothetical protein